MPDETDLRGAEARLGYTFTDESLGLIALNPSKKGFSRLEFLGDAVLAVVVFTLTESVSHPRSDARKLVSNDRLREIYMDSFAAHSPGNTGDVMEALVGAVYLDGGFQNAADVITRVIETRFGTFDQVKISANMTSFEQRGLMWIGAHTASAVAADYLCRTHPRQTHEFYSVQRSGFLRASRLAQRSRELDLVAREATSRPSITRDKNDTDVLDAHVATMFLRDGWDLAKPRVMDVLDITHTL